MRKLWISALAREEQEVRRVVAMARTYGLHAEGHFWEDDLAGMAWARPLSAMEKWSGGAWAILADPAALEPPSIRTGLSLLALALQDRFGLGFPIHVVAPGPGPAPDLPRALGGAQVSDLSDASLGVKLAASVARPAPAPGCPYHLGLHPVPGLGLWVSVGPRDGTWAGALVASEGAAPSSHAVGPRGLLPERSVLERPRKGFRLDQGPRAFEAWGVENLLDADQAYYVGFREAPTALRFGPLPGEGASAELHALDLA